MKFLPTLCCLLLCSQMVAQITRLDSLLVNKQYTMIEQELDELLTFRNDSSAYWYYYGKLYTRQRNLEKAFNMLKKVDTTELTAEFKSWYYYVLGDTYRYDNQEEKAYGLKLKAQKLFRKSDNKKMINEINFDLHYTLDSQDFLQYDGQSYIKDYLRLAKENNDLDQLSKGHLVLCLSSAKELSLEETLYHLEKATEYAYAVGTNIAKYRLHNYKAIYYQNRGYDFVKSKISVDSMLYYAEVLNSPDRLESSLKAKASLYRLQGRYKDAANTLLKADKLPIRENTYNRKRHLYQYLSFNYEDLGIKDSALIYYKKMTSYRDSINISNQNRVLALLETKELSEKNLKIDAERIKHKNRSLLTSLVLIAVVIIGTVLVLYYRSKKRLAEKEKELKAIDARNEEKDRQRQRIAGELHDNLGGLIVAIQQSFDNLKASKSRFQQEEENLMSKTRELLDEAYQKVRNMAHLEDSASRNSGYWVDVIKDFASIMNESNQLSIEVQSHGTANIVNISIENDLRRMTTELITNAVKHSKASEISVDITGDEKSITIIVEDDGIGLDISKLDSQKGLGLRSIKRKTENLNGEFTIDSTPNKGTSLIIEIPL